MNIEIVKVGLLQTNCYILSKNNNVLIIDPGDEYNKVMDKVNGRNIVGVLITNRYFDYIRFIDLFNKNLVYDYNNLNIGINTIGDFTFEVIHNIRHKVD